jgi:hypothetical protein
VLCQRRSKSCKKSAWLYDRRDDRGYHEPCFSSTLPSRHAAWMTPASALVLWFWFCVGSDSSVRCTQAAILTAGQTSVYSELQPAKGCWKACTTECCSKRLGGASLSRMLVLAVSHSGVIMLTTEIAAWTSRRFETRGATDRSISIISSMNFYNLRLS